MTARAVAALTLCAGLAAPASAQLIATEGFETGANGWIWTGEVSPSGGNPNAYARIDLGDFWGIGVRTDQPGPYTGDLTRYGGPLELTIDVRVFTLNNWFNEPIDPNNFPLVFQFIDAQDPTISVYWTGPGLPQIAAGWTTINCQVPDPTSTTMPAGWGGTGDEDPVTFEPRLPPGRTYTSVLRNVGEVKISTFRPGYFYIANWWEAGFDNVTLSNAGHGNPCYANCDDSTTTPVLNVQDFTCFLQRYAAGESYANCDQSTVAPVLNVQDFTCFLQSYAQGCN